MERFPVRDEQECQHLSAAAAAAAAYGAGCGSVSLACGLGGSKRKKDLTLMPVSPFVSQLAQ
jgi:hypothetical protein